MNRAALIIQDFWNRRKEFSCSGFFSQSRILQFSFFCLLDGKATFILAQRLVESFERPCRSSSYRVHQTHGGEQTWKYLGFGVFFFPSKPKICSQRSGNLHTSLQYPLWGRQDSRFATSLHTCARAHIGGAVLNTPLLAYPTQPWIEEGKAGDGIKSVEWWELGVGRDGGGVRCFPPKSQHVFDRNFKAGNQEQAWDGRTANPMQTNKWNR